MGEPGTSRRGLRRRIAVAVGAFVGAITLLAAAEGALRLAGMRAPRYAGLPKGVCDYWLPVSEPGKPAGYTRAFPRRNRVHQEPSQLFLAEKPKNGFRVFVLGESSVQGLPYEIGSFSDWLRLRLAAMMPGRVVEVVNAGNPGWHATEIRTLLQECLQHSPDLLVWMVGHNEMVPENVENLRREVEHPTRAALTSAVRELRLKRVLNQWIPSSATLRVVVHARDGSDGRPCWGPELDLLKQRFREATDGAATDAKNAGVPIVFCTLPRNIHTNPPAHSVLSEALRSNPIEMERWRSFIGFAKDAMTQRKDGAAALEFLHRAAKIDDAPAELHFEMARAHELTGDADAARAEYRRALELDGCPMRALAWVENTVREVAAARGAPLLDLERIFDAAGSLGIAGEELICDNVHPNLRGHEVIAEELLGVFERDLHLPLERRRDVSLEDGRRRLGLDVYAKMDALKSECLSNFLLVLEANKVDDWWTKTVEQCNTVLQYNPSDFEVCAALGCLRTLGGDAKTGKELLEKALAGDGYVQTSYVYYYKTQAPYRRLLELAGIDMAAEERKLTSGQRMQLEHRLTRAGAVPMDPKTDH